MQYSFKKWLILVESTVDNFNDSLDLIRNYARPNEEELKNIYVIDEEGAKNPDAFVVPLKQKKIISDVLKATGKDNQNFLKFALGYLTTGKNMLSEDLQEALEALKFKMDSGWRRREVDNFGWFNAGKKAKIYIQELRKEKEATTKGESLKQKKQGIAPDLTPALDNGTYKIYHIPKLKNINNKKDLDDRHKLLCKYGKGTDLCTAQPTGTYHENYAAHDIYIVQKDGRLIYQWVSCLDDQTDYNDSWRAFSDPAFMDEHETSFEDEAMQFVDAQNREIKFIPQDLYDILHKDFADQVECYKLAKKLTQEQFDKLPSKEQKYKYLQIFDDDNNDNPLSLLEYAKSVGDIVFKYLLDTYAPKRAKSGTRRYGYGPSKIGHLVGQIITKKPYPSDQMNLDVSNYFINAMLKRADRKTFLSVLKSYINPTKDHIPGLEHLEELSDNYTMAAHNAYANNDFDLFKWAVEKAQERNPKSFETDNMWKRITDYIITYFYLFIVHKNPEEAQKNLDTWIKFLFDGKKDLQPAVDKKSLEVAIGLALQNPTSHGKKEPDFTFLRPLKGAQVVLGRAIGTEVPKIIDFYQAIKDIANTEAPSIAPQIMDQVFGPENKK
jgi:hypothetical protein